MSETPAMTPEQWANELDPTNTALATRIGWALSEVGASDRVSRHALAALALWGQPFGFTREDVVMLQALVHFGGHKALASIADRIAALLPP